MSLSALCTEQIIYSFNYIYHDFTRNNASFSHEVISPHYMFICMTVKFVNYLRYTQGQIWVIFCQWVIPTMTKFLLIVNNQLLCIKGCIKKSQSQKVLACRRWLAVWLFPCVSMGWLGCRRVNVHKNERTLQVNIYSIILLY